MDLLQLPILDNLIYFSNYNTYLKILILSKEIYNHIHNNGIIEKQKKRYSNIFQVIFEYQYLMNYENHDMTVKKFLDDLVPMVFCRDKEDKKFYLKEKYKEKFIKFMDNNTKYLMIKKEELNDYIDFTLREYHSLRFRDNYTDNSENITYTTTTTRRTPYTSFFYSIANKEIRISEEEHTEKEVFLMLGFIGFYNEFVKNSSKSECMNILCKSKANLDFITGHPNEKWNYNLICSCTDNPIRELFQLEENVDLAMISSRSDLNIGILREFPNKKWNWKLICENKDICIDQLTNYFPDKIQWESISKRFKTIDEVLKYKDKNLDWNLLSKNIPSNDIEKYDSLPWNFDLVHFSFKYIIYHLDINWKGKWKKYV